MEVVRYAMPDVWLNCQVEEAKEALAVAGQFVPFARHTLDPPREMLPPVIVTFPDVKLVAWRFVPEAEVK